jgi:hypothetical protein
MPALLCDKMYRAILGNREWVPGSARGLIKQAEWDIMEEIRRLRNEYARPSQKRRPYVPEDVC